ncbi:HTH-type transcriptional regulator CueR [Oxobacter pfennigii]|uniref:HTH-type transcriptional regulator CueR n=1 Tax=Oxobacter pfennigii TaxID=36849 RepID=A0A0P9ADF3_9CLOT|nr:MerR family transcriptional regulator [Oxobacter pfennigii]KPU43141.1 HTH-type transcriptional regulator CueR [Oxobacter pfennigii]
MDQKYSISRAAKILGLSSEMLRYYERQGIIAPERASNGYRYFSFKDINMLMGARRYQGMGFSVEEVGVLINFASFNDIQQNLNEMEKKITKEIRWKQLILEAVKKQQNGYEKLKCLHNKYIIKTNPAVYRIHTQYNELFSISQTTLSR